MNTDILLSLLKYFSKFVPLKARERMFAYNSKNLPGYEEIKQEILNVSEIFTIPDIDTFVFSANERFVSDKVKNSKGIILFVEYGSFSLDPTVEKGLQEKLAIHIAMPYDPTNSDNLTETLILNKTNNILLNILTQMERDQKDLDFCGNHTLIDFPAEIVVIEPELFFNRTGWMAVFDNSKTILV